MDIFDVEIRVNGPRGSMPLVQHLQVLALNEHFALRKAIRFVTYDVPSINLAGAHSYHTLARDAEPQPRIAPAHANAEVVIRTS